MESEKMGRDDGGIVPYASFNDRISESAMPTSHRAVDTGGYLCYTRAAQARSASRRIDAGAMRKHRTGFFRFIREVKDSDMFRVSPA